MAKYDATVIVTFTVKADDEVEAHKLVAKAAKGLKIAAKEFGKTPTTEIDSVYVVE
jgi:hypothetical protein